MKKLIIITLATLLPIVAVAGDRALKSDLIGKFEKQFASEGDHSSSINAITNNSLKSLSLNRSKLTDHNKIFNFVLKSPGITNQKSSGRCWLFAGMNVFTPSVMTKLSLSEFQLSEPYLTFWDKMEKANLFLEAMIELRERPIDDRVVLKLLESPFGDGGWWSYVTDLMEKYGVVPLSAMPETKQSTKTSLINKLISRKLRMFTADLRAMHGAGKSENDLRSAKESMLYDIYHLLVFNYGQPPKEFKFRYEVDADSLSVPEVSYTPKSFYDEFFGQLPEFAPLMDDPNKAYGKVYQYDYSRNMADREDAAFLNIPLERLKAYCLKAMLDSQVVYFACDVGNDNMNDSGIFRIDIYDYGKTLQSDFKLTKKERLLYRDSSPNHAMVFIGVDTSESGQPVKWLVQNSWGEKYGDKGKWVMYDDWFNEYVYVAIIDKKYLDDQDAKDLESDPVAVPVWDPYWQAMR